MVRKNGRGFSPAGGLAMSDERVVSSAPVRKGKAASAAHLLLASPIIDLEQGRAVVLLAAQPDRRHPSQYQLDATVIPERGLGQGLRLAIRWEGGRRTARLDEGGCARLRGVPASVIEALRLGDHTALVLQVEQAMSVSNALG